MGIDHDLQTGYPGGPGGGGASRSGGPACGFGDCQKHGVPAARGGEDDLGAVLPLPVQDDVDRGAPSRRRSAARPVRRCRARSGHSPRGPGSSRARWSAARSHVRNTIPPASGSRSRKGSLESGSGLAATGAAPPASRRRPRAVRRRAAARPAGAGARGFSPWAASEVPPSAPGSPRTAPWRFQLRSSGADEGAHHAAGLVRVGLDRPCRWRGALLSLWVPRTSSTSCDQAIFVDQATDASLSSDAVLARDRPVRVAVSAARRCPGER